MNRIKISGTEIFYERILETYNSITSQPYDPLIDTMRQFNSDFKEFQGVIEHVELMMQVFVKEMLNPIPSTDSRLLILNRFEVLKLDCLCLDRRYLDVAQMLEKEIEDIKDM